MVMQDVTTLGGTLTGEPLPVALMNTVRHGRSDDLLAEPTGVAVWFHAVAGRFTDETGVDLGSLDEGDVRPVAGQLRVLRDALRYLAVSTTNDPRPPACVPGLSRAEAIGTVNALARTWPELIWPADGEPSRVYRSDERTTAGLAVGLIAHQGVELFAGPQRDLLRACLAPNCLLYFVKDHGRREWCSAACGNRARVARHYHRRHGAGAESGLVAQDGGGGLSGRSR